MMLHHTSFVTASICPRPDPDRNTGRDMVTHGQAPPHSLRRFLTEGRICRTLSRADTLPWRGRLFGPLVVCRVSQHVPLELHGSHATPEDPRPGLLLPHRHRLADKIKGAAHPQSLAVRHALTLRCA